MHRSLASCQGGFAKVFVLPANRRVLDARVKASRGRGAHRVLASRGGGAAPSPGFRFSLGLSGMLVLCPLPMFLPLMAPSSRLVRL